MILGFFPKKAAFPPFFRHSRPEAGRAAVLKCAAFLPPKKLRQKEMSVGRRCSHSTGVRRTPSPISRKPEEISARTRPGKEPGQWQYALPAREISSKAALWGGMGPVTVPGYGASVLPSLPENGSDFGENKVRQRTGAVAVRRYGAAPVLQHGRSSQPKDQALP